MKNAIINIKTNKAIKDEAQKLAEKMGLNLSLVLNAALKQFVSRKEVIFSEGNNMTPYLESIIAEAKSERANGESKGPFLGARDAIRYLRS